MRPPARAVCRAAAPHSVGTHPSMHNLAPRLARFVGPIVGLAALAALSGCKTSDINSAARALGALSGTDTSLSAAARSADRTDAEFDPGYERYLYRLGARRQARGLIPPPELRVAMRRQRHLSVIETLAQAGSVARRAAAPITRFIPYVNAGVVGKTATADPFARPKAVQETAKVVTTTLFRTP